MPALIIRPATKEDYPAVRLLLLQIAKLHSEWRPDLFTQNPKLTARLYNKQMKRPQKYPCLVAVSEGRIVGHMFGEVKRCKKTPVKLERRVFWIDDLCVDETCRLQGIGQRLVQEATLLARLQKCSAMELNVFSCNAAAIQFYQNQGFVPQRLGMECPIQGAGRR
jgi:ribosomal protein S18 acetylase RimI-like enzyme